MPLLFILLCSSSGSAPVESSIAIPSIDKPITGLEVIYGKNTPPPPGYVKIPLDLNKGAGGAYVYICYSRTAPGPPITNVQVFAGKSSNFPIQNGYTKIPKDLNKGTLFRLYIYLCYTTITSHPPITSLYVVQGSSRNTYPFSPEQIRVDQDCSEGAGGHYSYVIYQ